MRRGAYLYIAAGKQGFDILDVSDPTDPVSVLGGPQPAGGRTRGIAIAYDVGVPEDGATHQRNVVVLTEGGSGGQPGDIELRYADPAGTAGQSAAIGAHISGARLCNPIGSDLGGAQGEPTVVKTTGTTAFVSTIGVGMQEVDLAAVAQKNTQAVRFTMGSYPASPKAWDISMAMGGLGILPPADNNAGFVVAAVHRKGVVSWDVTSGTAGPLAAGYEPFPASIVSSTSGNMRLAVYPGYSYASVSNGKSTTKTTDLMVLAGGRAGLLIYELTPRGTSLDPHLKTVIPLGSAAYDATVDTRRHIAYVACYDSGVVVVDLSNPYKANPDNPYAMIDEDHNNTDDRIMGYLDVNTYSRATIVVDSETGIIYTGEGGVKSGVNAVGAQKPRMEFLLDDPQHPGQYKVPGYLSAFEGDKPRIGLWIPGGQGASISATLQLYDRKGFEETRQVIGQDASGGDILAPVSTVYRSNITLERQSNKKTDAKYNFYIQRNDNSNDAVTLGMIYDPDAANAANMMISKQSGSLEGEADLYFANDPGAWCGTANQGGNGAWTTSVSVVKPVSRPWVEWEGLVSVSKPTPDAKTKAADAGEYVVHSSERIFPVEMNTTFRVLISDEALEPIGGPIEISVSDPIKATLTPPTSITMSPGESFARATLKLLPAIASETPNGDALVFKRAEKVIGRIPITYYEMRLKDLATDQDIWEDSSVYITEDSTMPALEAYISPGFYTGTVMWRLKTTYDGYGDVAGGGLPKDDFYPEVGPYSGLDWEIGDIYPLKVRGGNASINYSVMGIPGEFHFKILGKNPNQQVAEGYIGPSPWYLQAMARHESGMQDGRCYLQFNEETISSYGKKGEPVVGSTIPHGFGMFQITWYSPPTKDQIWNWKENVGEAKRRLQADRTSARHYFYYLVRLAYGSQYVSPPTSYVIQHNGITKGHSALDIDTYIRFNGETHPVTLNIPGWAEPWTGKVSFEFDKNSKTWVFYDNGGHYGAKIAYEYEHPCQGGY